MKPKLKITLSMSFLTILLFMVILSFQDKPFWNNQIEPSQQGLPQNYQALLPKSGDPLGGGEEVSFEEAQSRISFPIPLPEAEKIKQVWISINPENPSDQSIAMRFKRDLLLIIHTSERVMPPDWNKTIAFEPLFKNIDVNGNSGMGADPGITEIRGQPYHYPGSAGWWVDGLDITLYSDTMPLEELLKIAETILPTSPSTEVITETPLLPTNVPTETLLPTATEILTETSLPIVELPTETPIPVDTLTSTP